MRAVPAEEEWKPFSISKEAFIVAMTFNSTDKIEDVTNIGIPVDKIAKVIFWRLSVIFFLQWK